LAQQRWTQAEKLTRRLQREFLQSRELVVDEQDDS
jgi:hypothetical protein